MIAIDMYGRLGNQMFKYAYARRILEERGNREPLYLGFRGIRNYDPTQGWNDALRDFNVVPYTSTNKRLWLYKGSLCPTPWLSLLSPEYPGKRR